MGNVERLSAYPPVCAEWKPGRQEEARSRAFALAVSMNLASEPQGHEEHRDIKHLKMLRSAAC